jgi:hypothetical protein
MHLIALSGERIRCSPVGRRAGIAARARASRLSIHGGSGIHRKDFRV